MVVALLLALNYAATWQKAAEAENQFYDVFGRSDYMDAKLGEWKPAKSYLTPSGTKHDVAADLAGAWNLSQGGMSGATLIFTKAKDDTFRVKFTTRGCLSAWKLQRTATLEDGIVTLNKAVESYSPATFDRLFFVKLHGVPTLIPAGSVERARELSEKGSFNFDSWIDYLSYNKQ